MNKKEQILKHYDAWVRGGTTLKRIANKVGTTREYVMQVFNYKELKEELANREPVEDNEIIEPDYGAVYLEPDIVETDIIEYKEITLFPKVNYLGDGRTELIYESKMNYERKTKKTNCYI